MCYIPCYRDRSTEDKNKLQQLLQQSSNELDTCREHITTKNKENLQVSHLSFGNTLKDKVSATLDCNLFKK